VVESEKSLKKTWLLFLGMYRTFFPLLDILIHSETRNIGDSVVTKMSTHALIVKGG